MGNDVPRQRIGQIFKMPKKKLHVFLCILELEYLNYTATKI